jgi:two-component sensor histidine kinase
MFPAGDGPVEICAYLRELCGAVACARLKRRKIRLLLIESEPQLLSAEWGWKLGLSVSELITNASKHAFGANGGLVRVELARDGAMMKCCVRDDGRNEGVSRPGQGLTLIRSLVQSVGGALDYAFGKSGGISLISMPGWEGLKRVK